MLEQKLIEYAKQDIYPFHMPGHKRMILEKWYPYEIDITEIDGFDNLHHAKEILLEAQKRAARLYGVRESFYLINGSTCGILASISAVVSKQEKILVARNCHKSVYNSIFLRELEPIYIYPEITNMGLQGQIKKEQVEQLLQENPDTKAVFITSPTYDGIVSDVAGIAEIVHRYHIPLIVDAAHGAHFGFTKGFPENPVHLGADIVIESVHKTLPAFTQTALLHVCSRRISIDKIVKYLGIYESSSPSYVLMAGLDACISYMEEHGVKKLKKLEEYLEAFYKRSKSLKNIKILTKEEITKEEAFDFDFSKILIFSKKQEVTGADLAQVLLEKYHLQMEMTSGQYVLALCSLMDTEEGFLHLIQALEAVDDSELFSNTTDISKKSHNIYHPKEKFLPIHKAEEMEKNEVSLKDAIGKISGEYLYLYPPGIPFLVPGEIISKEVIEDIRKCQSEGLEILGLSDKDGIFIVNFS